MASALKGVKGMMMMMMMIFQNLVGCYAAWWRWGNKILRWGIDLKKGWEILLYILKYVGSIKDHVRTRGTSLDCVEYKKCMNDLIKCCI